MNPFKITLYILASTHASGAGYQLSERSVRGLGRAFSGESAIGDEASILGSNPAGMSLLSDWSFSMGSNLLLPQVNARGVGTTGSISDKRVVADASIPNFYGTKKITSNLSFGFGAFTTFGLDSDYSTNFATGAAVDRTQLLTFNLNPALSYRLSTAWSAGAGFNGLYADGQISSRQPGSGENLFDLAGNDWGYGYNIGTLYQLGKHTRFGLHYRSAIDLKINGSAEVGSGFGAFPSGNYGGTLELKLPDTIEFSAYHELDENWAIHADFLWTNWSSFKKLEPKVNPLLDPSLAKSEDWEDSIRISVGATYQYRDNLTFRAGLAFDESPVEDKTRTLRIPDEDRIWASLGASYKLNDSLSLDLGYTHIFAENIRITPAALGGNSDAFSGTLEGSVDLFGIGLSGRL